MDAVRAVQPVRGLCIAVTLLLGVWCLVAIAGAAISLQRLQLINRLLAGDSTVDISEVEANDAWYVVTNLLQGAVWLAAGIVFLVWLTKARGNAEAIAPEMPHRRHRRWLVFGWIVPVVCLWFPVQIVSDVLTASEPEARPTTLPPTGTRSGLIYAWWATFVLMSWGDWLISRLLLRSETLESYRNVSVTEIAVLPVGIAAAVLAALVVRKISALQQPAIG